MTKAEARRATKWFQEQWSIQDWAVRVHISDNPPDWAEFEGGGMLGRCRYFPVYKTADVWISPGRAADHFEEGVLNTLFHELAHVVLHDQGIDGGADPHHALVQRMAVVSGAAYQATRRPKKARRR